MFDVTFLELHVHDSFDFPDSFDFHPTTTVGEDALPVGGSADDAVEADPATADPAASADAADGTEAVASPASVPGRALLTAVALAAVSAAVAVAVSRLLSDDDLSDLSDLDERETPADDGTPRPP